LSKFGQFYTYIIASRHNILWQNVSFFPFGMTFFAIRRQIPPGGLTVRPAGVILLTDTACAAVFPPRPHSFVMTKRGVFYGQEF
jgi:hypothetical protein